LNRWRSAAGAGSESEDKSLIADVELDGPTSHRRKLHGVKELDRERPLGGSLAAIDLEKIVPDLHLGRVQGRPRVPAEPVVGG
jgi:hypothetical protein